MKHLIFFLLIPTLIFAQEFEFIKELDSISVTIDGHNLAAAWLAGYYYSQLETVDLDDDGDYDMMVGGYFYMDYFENEGDQSLPEFHYPVNQYFSFDSLYLAGQSACDINADGDFDVFGTTSGVIVYLENIGLNNLPEFVIAQDTLLDESGQYIFGNNIDWVDIEADGDFDLFIGRGNGELCFYENVGDSTQHILRLITLNFEGINFGSQGNPYPCFCDIDDDDDFDLLLGHQNGKLYFYENIGSQYQVEFADPINYWLGIDAGDWSAPEFCDIDGDGDFDLFIGKGNDYDPTPAGDVQFWRNIGNPEVYNFVQENEMYLTFDAGETVEVQLVDQENDEDGDIFFHTQMLGWMRNVGTNINPSFDLMSMNIMNVGVGGFGLCDLDNDSDDDMIFSLGWQVVTKYYENRGTALNPYYVYRETITTDTVSSATFTDLDLDGDKDMLMVHYNWTTGDSAHIWLYENQGTPEDFDFVLIDQHYEDITLGPGSQIDLVDYDFDGDYDLLVGDDPGGRIYYYENCGNLYLADFIYAGEFNIEPYFPLNSGFYDIDNDQDIDIFAGQMSGGVVFFRNITGETGVGPKRPLGPPVGKIDLGLAPNPGNPVTCISFTLPSPQEATLAVYNILGARVTTLASGLQPPGEHSFYWNNSQVSSGVYIIRLETVEAQEVRKVVVVK